MTFPVEASPSVQGPDGAETWTRDDWNTPEWVLAPVRKLAGGRIGLDPCSNPTSIVDAAVEVFAVDDGLSLPWGRAGLVFVNPPYSRGLFDKFAIKCASEGEGGTEVIALVPANCETRAWRDYLWEADAVCFLGRRVRFLKDGKPKGTPAFGSAVCYWGPRPGEFAEAFAEVGKTVFPQAGP